MYFVCFGTHYTRSKKLFSKSRLKEFVLKCILCILEIVFKKLHSQKFCFKNVLKILFPKFWKASSESFEIYNS